MAQQAEDLGRDPVVNRAKDADLVTDRKPVIETTADRPPMTMILAILMFLSSAWALPFVILSDQPLSIPLPYGIFLAVSAGVGVVASLAAWMMRRWSVWVYGAIWVINMAVTVMVGHFDVWMALVPIVVFGLGLTQLKDMV